MIYHENHKCAVCDSVVAVRVEVHGDYDPPDQMHYVHGCNVCMSEAYKVLTAQRDKLAEALREIDGYMDDAPTVRGIIRNVLTVCGLTEQQREVDHGR